MESQEAVLLSFLFKAYLLTFGCARFSLMRAGLR